jgi:hypothetical protein
MPCFLLFLFACRCGRILAQREGERLYERIDRSSRARLLKSASEESRWSDYPLPRRHGRRVAQFCIPKYCPGFAHCCGPCTKV